MLHAGSHRSLANTETTCFAQEPLDAMASAGGPASGESDFECARAQAPGCTCGSEWLYTKPGGRRKLFKCTAPEHVTICTCHKQTLYAPSGPHGHKRRCFANPAYCVCMCALVSEGRVCFKDGGHACICQEGPLGSRVWADVAKRCKAALKVGQHVGDLERSRQQAEHLLQCSCRESVVYCTYPGDHLHTADRKKCRCADCAARREKEDAEEAATLARERRELQLRQPGFQEEEKRDGPLQCTGKGECVRGIPQIGDPVPCDKCVETNKYFIHAAEQRKKGGYGEGHGRLCQCCNYLYHGLPMIDCSLSQQGHA